MVLQAIATALGTSVPKLVLNTVVFVASTAYQINQAKRLEREADKRKGHAINKRGEAVHIPVVYGKQAVGLIEANHHVSDSANPANVAAGGTTFGSQNEISFGSGTKNEFLNMNGAICQGEIEGVQSLTVDEQIYNRSKEHRHRIDTYTNGLSASAPLGNGNGLPDNNKFTKLANADCVFRLNRDEPNYNNIPSLTFFVKGKKVRDINSNGTFSSSRIYSNNPALILADYLTSDVGRNLEDSGLDLYSFYQAKVICDTPVKSNAPYAGSVNGVKPIEDFNTRDDFPGISTWPNTNTDEPDSSVIYRAIDTGAVYEFTSTGTEENPAGSYAISALPTRTIPLYECNIVLDSEARVRDNIEEILSTMPLATLAWSSEVKYRLRLAYPNTESDFSVSGGSAEAVITFDSDNVIRDSINISWLAATERYNKATVTFLDEHENFKENSVTWPLEGSSAYNTLLNQDNGQPMTIDLNLNGVTDPYHAQAYAEFTVRQSRTFHTLSFTATKVALGLEPGDYIKVHKSITGNNISGTNFGYTSQTDFKYYKVNSIEINQDFTVKVEAHFVDLLAFEWNVEDDYVPIGDPGRPDFRIGAPSNVVFNSSLINTLGTWSGTLTWNPANDISVINYILQISKYDETLGQFGQYNDIGFVSKDTTSFEVPGLQAGTYRFGVRAVSSSGAISSRAISINYTLEFSGRELVAKIYADGPNQDTNNQSYTLRSTDTHFVITSIQLESLPTLPIRSSPSVSDATEYTKVLDFITLTAPSTITIPLYKRSTTDITGTAVTGGTYNFFDQGTLTPPSGWKPYVPSGVGVVYGVTAKATGLDKENRNVDLQYPGVPENDLTRAYPAILGAEGNPAPRYQVTRVYNESATAGNPPSGTITWDTLSVSIDTSGTGVNSGWTTTQPTIDADSTNDFWFSDIIFTDTTGEATTTGPVTGSTPGKQINFDGIVSFTDINTEGGMGTTTIHGSNITTGTLTADQLIVSASNTTNLNQYISDTADAAANAAASDGQLTGVDALTNQVNALSDSQITVETGNALPTNNTNTVDGSVFHVVGNTTNISGGQIYRYDGGNANWIPFSIIADSVATNYVYAGDIYTDNLRVGTANSSNAVDLSNGLSTFSSNIGQITGGSIQGTNLKAGTLIANSNTGALNSGQGMYASSNGAFAVGKSNSAQYISFNPTGNGTITMAGTIVNFSQERLALIDSGVQTVTSSTNTFVPVGGTGEYVFAIMGGGGAGGSNSATASLSNSRKSHNGASGGGAGGFAIGQYTYNGGSFKIVIGAGGNGTSSGSIRNNQPGNAGGESSLRYGNTYLLRAYGGNGGGQNTGGNGGNALSNLTDGEARQGGHGGDASIGCMTGGGAVDCFGSGQSDCSAGNVATQFPGNQTQGNVDTGPPYYTASFSAGGSCYGTPSNIGTNTLDSFTVPSTSNTASAVRTRIANAGNTAANGTYNRFGTFGPSLQPNVLGPGGTSGLYFGNYDQGNTGSTSFNWYNTTVNNSNSFVGGLVGAPGADTNNVYPASGGNSVFGGGGAGGSGGSDSNSNFTPDVYGGSSQYGGGGGGCARGRGGGIVQGGDGGDGLFLYLKL